MCTRYNTVRCQYVCVANSQHIEIRFLAKRCIAISIINRSLVYAFFFQDCRLVLITPLSIAFSRTIKNISCSNLERTWNVSRNSANFSFLSNHNCNLFKFGEIVTFTVSTNSSIIEDIEIILWLSQAYTKFLITVHTTLTLIETDCIRCHYCSYNKILRLTYSIYIAHLCISPRLPNNSDSPKMRLWNSKTWWIT